MIKMLVIMNVWNMLIVKILSLYAYLINDKSIENIILFLLYLSMFDLLKISYNLIWYTKVVRFCQGQGL